jgi:cysteine-rich repeat protein
LAGYLAEIEADLDSSGSADTADTAQSSTASSDADASDSSAGTTVDTPDTTSTGTGTGTGVAEDSTTQTINTSTGEPIAECGNGIIEASGAIPEECDDGNLDPLDGCDDTCAIDRRVFVTSIQYQAAELESLYIADALCFNLADDQGWPDPLKYRAWLSDSHTDARDRFKRGRGRLVMANGLVFAASWPALLAGQLQNPLEVTEKSETYQNAVWTGTRPDGTAVPGAQHCDDWSNDSILKTGHYGWSFAKTPEWTLSALDDNPVDCGLDLAIYCIQSL